MDVLTMTKKYTDPNLKDVPSILNTSDVADVLGIHINTVKGLIATNQLPHFRVGRTIKVRKADLMKYAGINEGE